MECSTYFHKYLFSLFCECLCNYSVFSFLGVKATHTCTNLSLVYWKFHSSNCPYQSPSITVFSLPLSIKCDSNKSLFITPGNSDVRPDPKLGSRPIQLEHINEKSCTIQPDEHRRRRRSFQFSLDGADTLSQA